MDLQMSDKGNYIWKNNLTDQKNDSSAILRIVINTISIQNFVLSFYEISFSSIHSFQKFQNFWYYLIKLCWSYYVNFQWFLYFPLMIFYSGVGWYLARSYWGALNRNIRSFYKFQHFWYYLGKVFLSYYVHL